jgi:hypothetical protein
MRHGLHGTLINWYFPIDRIMDEGLARTDEKEDQIHDKPQDTFQ